MAKIDETAYGVNIRLTGDLFFTRYTTVNSKTEAEIIAESLLVPDETHLWEIVEIEKIDMIDGEPHYTQLMFAHKDWYIKEVLYQSYLDNWYKEHSDPEYEGMEPACYDEWYDCEFMDYIEQLVTKED